VIGGYAAMLIAAAAIFFVIRAVGENGSDTVVGPAPKTPSVPAPHANVLLHVLLALATIIVVGRLLGTLFSRLGQPPVIGEVVAGILLGPSLLGYLSPEAMAFILPQEVMPHLGVLAQLGVILYMFLVGLDLNSELLHSRAHATVAISHASIVVPFLLGAALALWLYRSLAPEGVPFTSFALFMGVAMAITAFPVLARILTDRGIEKTELGVMALTCAAVDDATAWCLLALAVGVAQAQVGGAVGVIAMALAFVAVMVFLIGPVAARWLRVHQGDTLPTHVTVGVLVALLASSLATEAIGIHAVFGAFLLGAVIPHDSAVTRVFTRKLEDVVTILLLPAFFAYTGMRTQIGLVATLEEWLICGVIIVVATAGKFGGTLAAARFTGLPWRTSAALGILMNTRGLMQLIVLNIGLDLGVISETLFAMLVVMALVTTVATTPVLKLLEGKS
jgi:Kef-type K+ transport system membrane component KefB